MIITAALIYTFHKLLQQRHTIFLFVILSPLVVARKRLLTTEFLHCKPQTTTASYCSPDGPQWCSAEVYYILYSSLIMAAGYQSSVAMAAIARTCLTSANDSTF
jgi:hypothetical protein